MFKNKSDEDTIIAEITPSGKAGVSAVRISGNNSLKATRLFFKKIPKDPVSHHIYFGNFTDNETMSKIDEVVVTYFKIGNSFTGDETVEITSHGSPIIVEKILKSYISTGLVRLAEPGEFSYRAVLNGKIDLIQAESIHEIIFAQNELSLSVSMRQLSGELSQEFELIIEKLTTLLALLEASIDFSDQDIEIASNDFIIDQLNELLTQINVKKESFKKGKQIKQGVKISIVGAPNAGKSSLLNKLVKQEKSIVTDIAGTTRDAIETSVEINGVPFTFVDTAGIRINTDDKIEKLGIQRSIKHLNESDIVFVVFDGSLIVPSEILEMLKTFDKVLVFIENKNDLPMLTNENRKLIDKNISKDYNYLSVCCSDTVNIYDVENFLNSYSQSLHSSLFSLPLISARHYNCLALVSDSIEKASELLFELQSPEFPSFELQLALEELYKLMGKNLNDEIMDSVFRDFCLGK